MLTFEQRLYELRKQKGLSQEGLAEEVGVSRQAVQKWESGASTPDLQNLALLCDYFGVTMDYLVRGAEARPAAQAVEAGEGAEGPPFGYYRYGRVMHEYKSKRTLFGLPLVHINFGYGFARAKGIIAVGNVATGFIAVGGLAAGFLSIGGVGVGLLTLAGLAGGAFFAFGGLAFSLLLSFGGIAVSAAYAMGGLAVGVKGAVGGLAVASEIAAGGEASGGLALGQKMLRQMTGDEVERAIRAAYPDAAGWLVRLIRGLAGQ